MRNADLFLYLLKIIKNNKTVLVVVNGHMLRKTKSSTKNSLFYFALRT